MKVIEPITFDVGTQLVSTDAPPDALDAWTATTYTTGSRVTHANFVWEAISYANDWDEPGVSWLWLLISAINEHAMFDGITNSKTTSTDSLTVVVAPGAIDACGFIGLVGEELTLTGLNSMDEVVFEKTLDLIDGGSGAQIAEAVAFYLPAIPDLELTIELTGTGTVGIGEVVFGTSHSLGTTQDNANASLIDYSVKEADEYGNYQFVERGWAKRLTVITQIRNNELNGVFATMTRLRATPTLWAASEVGSFGAIAVVFGFYREFSVDVKYPFYSLCNLEIEGLT